MAALHISISAETVAHLGSLAISNSMLTSLVVSGLIVAFAVIVGSQIKHTGKPSRLQAMVEIIIEGLYNLGVDITGSRKKAATFLPIVGSFFIFIMLNNWAGLLPGVGTIGFREVEETTHSEVVIPNDTLLATTNALEVEPRVDQEAGETVSTEKHENSEGTNESHAKEGEAKGVFVPYFRAGTADLNTTIALALVSVASTQYFGIKALGGSYFKKYINFSSPIMFFVGILELILELAKIMSFAFRLFGNIFAGEVLLTVIAFLVPVVVPMPFYGLELFVGMIQAVVFAMLSLVFFNLATIGHDHEEEH